MELSQRAPAIFGWAAITFGIGPHSSLYVCMLATLRKKTSERICIKFSVKVGNGPIIKRLNFGGDSYQGSGYGSGYISRRALAEVCTVAMLLV